MTAGLAGYVAAMGVAVGRHQRYYITKSLGVDYSFGPPAGLDGDNAEGHYCNRTGLELYD